MIRGYAICSFRMLFVLESDVLRLLFFEKKPDFVRVDRKIIFLFQIVEKIEPVLMVPCGVVFFHKVHRDRGLREFLEVAFRFGECFCHFRYPFRI